MRVAWFRKDGSVDPDDTPTGQIAAVSITQIVEEADAEKGTGGPAVASDTDVHPLQPVDSVVRPTSSAPSPIARR